MQFKKEVGLLLLAISLFAVATFFYTFQATNADAASLAASISYPYRSIGLAFVGIGFASMVAASISYQRKTKSMANTI